MILYETNQNTNMMGLDASLAKFIPELKAIATDPTSRFDRDVFELIEEQANSFRTRTAILAIGELLYLS